MDTDGSPIFDSLDVDLVMKVLSNTAFSQWIFLPFTPLIECVSIGPFFVFWIPMFYRAQGIQWNSPIVSYSLAYFAGLCLFCKS